MKDGRHVVSRGYSEGQRELACHINTPGLRQTCSTVADVPVCAKLGAQLQMSMVRKVCTIADVNAREGWQAISI